MRQQSGPESNGTEGTTPYSEVYGGACGVIREEAVGISHSVNTLEKGIQLFSFQLRQTRLFNLGMATSLGEGKF